MTIRPALRNPVNKICDELEKRIAEKKGVFPEKTPRILVSGCPQAVPNWKLPFIVETSGAVIVGEESCVGERGTRNLTDDIRQNGRRNDGGHCGPLFQGGLRHFHPQSGTFGPYSGNGRYYKADGVIHYGLQFCQPYLMESMPVEKALKEKNIPCAAHRNRLQHGRCGPVENPD